MAVLGRTLLIKSMAPIGLFVVVSNISGFPNANIELFSINLGIIIKSAWMPPPEGRSLESIFSLESMPNFPKSISVNFILFPFFTFINF